jgi:hypothetical protein
MVKVGQAGLILDTFGFVNVIPGMDAAESKTEIGSDLATYFLTPWLVSKLLTDPRAVRSLTRAMTMKPGSQQAGGVMAQLMFHVGEIFDQNPVEFQKQEG